MKVKILITDPYLEKRGVYKGDVFNANETSYGKYELGEKLEFSVIAADSCNYEEGSAVVDPDDVIVLKSKRNKQHELMQFFAYEHLPKEKQQYSKPFGILAKMLDENLPENSEKTAALKRLLEAKDCAVRSSFQRKQ